MDAIQFLKQEHEKAKAAFGKALQAPPDMRGALWAEVWGETRLKRAGTEMEEMKSKTKRDRWHDVCPPRQGTPVRRRSDLRTLK